MIIAVKLSVANPNGNPNAETFNMAPKRTLEQSDANIQSTRDPKQQKRDETGNEAENREPTDAGAEKRAGPEVS